MVSDRTIEVAGLMNHFWLTLFSTEQLKVKSGLKYISHTYDEHSSWYLWLDHCPGVYKLELQGAQKIEGYDWLAEFLIKYYPSRSEEAFHKLSILEKICRESKVFDTHPAEGPPGCSCHGHSSENNTRRFGDLLHGTGVPSFQFKKNIPPDFFYAGNMVLAFREKTGSIMKLKSQTSWHVSMVDDFKVTDAEGNHLAILNKGEVDRDYPGFALCNILFENILRNWTLFHGYPVKESAVYKGPGVRFLSNGTSLTKQVVPDIDKIIAHVELRHHKDKKLAHIPDEDMVGTD
jgi:hypothetical protein